MLCDAPSPASGGSPAVVMRYAPLLDAAAQAPELDREAGRQLLLEDLEVVLGQVALASPLRVVDREELVELLRREVETLDIELLAHRVPAVLAVGRKL